MTDEIAARDEHSIEWPCDACDRSFPVAPDAGKVPCPYCGDVNRIVPSEIPATSRTQSSKPEDLLRMVRPALVRGHPMACLGVAVLAVGGATLAVMSNFNELAWQLWVGLASMAASGIWSLWLFVFGHRWDRLRITSHRVIDERGILKRSTSEVLHGHVRNIRITQSIWQRIVGIGDLEIDSAAGDGEADIRIANVPGPDAIKRLIDRYRGLGDGE